MRRIGALETRSQVDVGQLFIKQAQVDLRKLPVLALVVTLSPYVRALRGTDHDAKYTHERP